MTAALSMTERLANTFAIVLREWLTDDEMTAIVAENARRNDGSCATHDHCDSNEAMIEACDRIGYDWGDPDDIINSAWSLAKGRGFTANA